MNNTKRSIKLLLHWLAGGIVATYLWFVWKTSFVTYFPSDNPYCHIDNGDVPVIITFWHGQHLMQTFYRRKHDRCAVMISKHADGEINAFAAKFLGMDVVRGSGAQRSDQVQKRGGSAALRGLLSILRRGSHVALTADVPKISRVVGDGILTLSQLSGRPILPIAVVSKRRIDFKSWDAASLALPFNRLVIALGNPVVIPSNISLEEKEAKRQSLEQELDRLYGDSYAFLGCVDPGANRLNVLESREKKRKMVQDDNNAKLAKACKK